MKKLYLLLLLMIIAVGAIFFVRSLYTENPVLLVNNQEIKSFCNKRAKYGNNSSIRIGIDSYTRCGKNMQTESQGREIVVNQGIGVDHLHRHREGEGIFPLSAHGVGRGEGQDGPEPLSPREEGIAHGPF